MLKIRLRVTTFISSGFYTLLYHMTSMAYFYDRLKCILRSNFHGKEESHFFLDLMLHCVHNEATKSQKCTRDLMTHARKLRIHYIKISTIISIIKGIHLKIIIWNIVGLALKMKRINRLFRILILWIKYQLKSFPGYGSCCIEKVHPYPRGHHNECNMLTRWGKIYLDNEKLMLHVSIYASSATM